MLKAEFIYALRKVLRTSKNSSNVQNGACVYKIIIKVRKKNVLHQIFLNIFLKYFEKIK